MSLRLCCVCHLFRGSISLGCSIYLTTCSQIMFYIRLIWYIIISLSVNRTWKSTLIVQEVASVQRQFRYAPMHAQITPVGTPYPPYTALFLTKLPTNMLRWQRECLCVQINAGNRTGFWFSLSIDIESIYAVNLMCLICSRFTTSCWRAWPFVMLWISSTETWSHRTFSSAKYTLYNYMPML